MNHLIKRIDTAFQCLQRTVQALVVDLNAEKRSLNEVLLVRGIPKNGPSS